MWEYETSIPVWKYMINDTLNIGKDILLVDDYHFSTKDKLSDEVISALSLLGTVKPHGKVAIDKIRYSQVKGK